MMGVSGQHVAALKEGSISPAKLGAIRTRISLGAAIFMSSLSLASPVVAQTTAPSETEAAAPADAVIENLLEQMTLEEKIGQLSLYPTGFEILDADPTNPTFRMKPPEARFDDIRAGLVTGILQWLR